jgi:acyl transferase domain-containing protein
MSASRLPSGGIQGNGVHGNQSGAAANGHVNGLSPPGPIGGPGNGHVNGYASGRTNGHANGAGGSSTPSEHSFAAGGNAPYKPLAVCGMGMRLPGGIADADSFWDLLVNGRDARTPVPASRYNIDGFDDSLAGKGAIRARHGYFLTQDLAQLDTSFFSMTKSEVEGCDPQQRLLLEVVGECFEDAGEVDYRGKSVGCYVGTFGEDWLQMTSKDVQQSTGYIMTGSSDLMIANRVSYEYDLRGPRFVMPSIPVHTTTSWAPPLTSSSFVVKTACSASLVALHEACRSISCGDSKAAIVAGTSLIMGPMTTAAMSAQGILSPDGSCKTFDAAADGFARGEAITAVYIKPLEDAIRDGNPIRSVIRATGTNSDGRSHGIMNPRAEAHEALMRQVYASAGLDPRETAFVEVRIIPAPGHLPFSSTNQS